jgi:hypothetical protein
VQFSSGVPVSTSLQWTAVVNALSYRVQASNSVTFATLVVDDSAALGSSKSVGPLVGGTDHYWRVRARNGFGEGPWSEIGLFTTGFVVPGVPTLVSPASFATGVSPSTMLTWNAVGGATFYGVQLATESSFAVPLFNDTTVTGTSRATGVLAGNTDYYWRVRARSSAGSSDWAVTRKFTTGALPLPGTPTLVSPPNFAGFFTLPQLVWTSSSFAANYQVQLSTDPGFSVISQNDSTLTDTTRAAVGVVLGTNYWRVRARNATGVSNWSEIRSFNQSPDAILPGQLSAFRLALNGGRTLRFELRRPERVKVALFDVRGTRLFTRDEVMGAGPHELTLPASGSGGIRLLDIRMGGSRETLKLHP